MPRESQDVFRIVTLRNPLNAPLLAGPADVYVAGRFALTSDLDTTPTGWADSAGPRAQGAIKIARNVHYAEDSAGLLKRQHALQHTLEIEIGNNLAGPASVEVRERLSTFGEDQASAIQITVGEVSPAGNDFNSTSRRSRAASCGPSRSQLVSNASCEPAG